MTSNETGRINFNPLEEILKGRPHAEIPVARDQNAVDLSRKERQKIFEKQERVRAGTNPKKLG